MLTIESGNLNLYQKLIGVEEIIIPSKEVGYDYDLFYPYNLIY